MAYFLSKRNFYTVEVIMMLLEALCRTHTLQMHKISIHFSKDSNQREIEYFYMYDYLKLQENSQTITTIKMSAKYT